MTDNSVFKLTQPGTFSDPLTEVLRSGARALLWNPLVSMRQMSFTAHVFCQTTDHLTYLETWLSIWLTKA